MVNWFVMDDFMESMAVSIPTRAIMPIAMMQIVRIVRTLFDLIALKEILRFSQNNPILKYLRFCMSACCNKKIKVQFFSFRLKYGIL